VHGAHPTLSRTERLDGLFVFKFFLLPKKYLMLTPQQIDSIVVKIQALPKLPKALKKGLGKSVFKGLLNQIDVLLTGALPPETYALINSASDGLTEEETEHLKDSLTTFLTEKVKNPIAQNALPFVLPLIVDEIISALQHGKVLA
jgi:hypothetical protein